MVDPATGAACCTIVLELERRAQNTIIRHVKYITCFTKYVEHFQTRLEKFETAIIDIQKTVAQCDRNLKEPRMNVQFLLRDLNEFLVKYEGDIENLKGILNLEGNVKCFPRYKLSKKAQYLKEEMIQLMTGLDNIILPNEFNPVPETIVKISTKYVKGLESVEKTKVKIISAIKEANTVVIGLHGMAGVGKTTLIQQINNELKNDPHIRFTYVIFVEVSNSPNIKKLQDQIGERLGLDIKNIESKDVRASILLKRLKKENILIILDNVWNKLDLSTIGIPRGNGENKCCKIVLTTRNEDVCRQMDAGIEIFMDVLKREEAWKLFESYSDVIKSESIREIAEKVCEKCAGLPLEISTVASTLRHDERKHVWKHFLSKMSQSNSHDSKVRLKLSYEELSDHEKWCFLFCSLFPQDYEIHLNDLIYYGLGEGFVTYNEKVCLSLDEILTLIDKLKSHTLLLDVADKDEMYVKMHNVVRGMAISITEELDIYTNFNDLTKWPEGVKSQTKRISLMGNSIISIDDSSKFHGEHMKSLLLNDNESLETIADDFFEEMGDLHILDIRETRLKSLPTSFQKLKKLRVLAISHCYNLSGGISLRDHLLSKKDLVVLFLRDARIPELTKEFGELVHLKVLDFNYTRIDIIRPNVLSKLKKLEQLRMIRSFNRWNESDKDGDFVPFFELGSLERLYALEVEVFDEKFALSSKEEPFDFLSSLEFFAIILGDFDKVYSDDKILEGIYADIVFSDKLNKKILLLTSPETSESISTWIMVLMKKAEKLHLGDGCINSLKQNLINNTKFLSNLTTLRISRCKTLKVLIDFSKNTDGGAVIIPKVKNICLEKLDEMENIFVIPIAVPDRSFQSLKDITIMHCQALRSIFPWNVAVCLVHLEFLDVRNCSSLEYVIVIRKDNSDYYNKGQVLFPKLRHLSLHDLQNLKSLLWQQESEERMEMEFSSLKSLQVSDCMKLKRLYFGEKSAPELLDFYCSSEEWFDELQWEDWQAASRFKSIAEFYF